MSINTLLDKNLDKYCELNSRLTSSLGKRNEVTKDLKEHLEFLIEQHSCTVGRIKETLSVYKQ